MAENDENRYISISQMVAKENIETEKYQVIPRQEAIDRMVLAMHNELIWRNLQDKPCDFRNYAEAALDALLFL